MMIDEQRTERNREAEQYSFLAAGPAVQGRFSSPSEGIVTPPALHFVPLSMALLRSCLRGQAPKRVRCTLVGAPASCSARRCRCPDSRNSRSISLRTRCSASRNSCTATSASRAYCEKPAARPCCPPPAPRLPGRIFKEFGCCLVILLLQLHLLCLATFRIVAPAEVGLM